MKFLHIRHMVLALALTFLCIPHAQAEERAICYNCPPEWAGWGNQLKLVQKETGIFVPQDNKNSGQSVSQLIAEKANPVADVSYLGISFAINAQDAGVLTPYKSPNWDQIPAGMKDPDGWWVATHSGTFGFMVNVDALEGKPVPTSWKDLLDPKYKGMVGFLDPSSAFVGYVGAVAVNTALGGNLDNFDPAIDYFKTLLKNQPIIPKQTAYARVLSGEIPILFDYDFNAYRARYQDKANVVFVIPAEGTIKVPYVMTLVKDSPNQANGKKVIDFVQSEKGQALWAQNFLMPVIPSAMSADVAEKFLPVSEYQRAGTVDYAKMAKMQQGFMERFLQNIR